MNKRFNTGLGGRILVAFVVAVIVSIVTSMISSSALRKNQELTTELVSTSMYDKVIDDFDQITRVAKTMSYDSFLKDFVENEESYSEEEAEQIMSEYLSAIKYGNGWTSAFLISDKTMRYYTPDGIGKIVDPENDEYDVWYSLFVESGNDVDLDINIDQYNAQDYTVFVDKRMEGDSGDLLAVCGVGMIMSDLQEMLDSYEQQYGVDITFVDEKGETLLGSNVNNLNSSYLYVEIPDNDYGSYTKRNGNGFVVSKYVSALGWSLVVKNDKGYSFIDRFKILIVSVIAFIFIMIALVIIDIFKRKNLLKYMNDDIFRDDLTGLINADGFEIKTMDAIEDLKTNKKGGALFAIDLDNFMSFSDYFGKESGDEYVLDVCNALKEIFSTSDIVSRAESDMFLVFAPNMTNEGYIDDICDKILNCATKEYEDGEKKVTNTVSIGISLYPKEAFGYKDLLAHTKRALRAAKDNGKNCAVKYDTIER
ncbi:MAG: diguanylate cyclase [Lachnospiraceae bacterium]|nr:diguanylate cyclase [Lachnospiraceae bacterium]